MADSFALVISGLEHLKSIDDLPQDIIRSARIAVNDAATRGRTAMGREVLRQVNFPADYVAPRNKRLYVSKNATGRDLEAVVTARSRPTSLSRFLTRSAQPGYQPDGVSVAVHRGATRTIGGKDRDTKAFLFKLRSGSQLTDTKFNLGLAVRTKDGRAPDRAYRPAPLGKGLWLLYGPAVAQVIFSERNNGGVATDLTPEIQDMLEDEFWRQMELT